ncbi:MAG: Glycosyltransferase [Candidatus Levybacteria bacterium GW2011_GWA1_37_16]|nr:MAG: Glycosyltransferase [Candidatus Levybacteria bacterium GW2011_GWA1_37_16]
MKIGIDISQIIYEGTGVAELVRNLVENLLRIDKKNEYVLFFSSLRKNLKSQISNFKSTSQNLKIKTFRFPPILLDLLWNKLHILPIEWLIGDVDIFITSDWTEPPTVRAKKVTILYDLIVYKYPNETDRKIIEVQKRKLKWVKKESDLVLCISESTKRDAINFLRIDEKRLKVIYPGV